ncbi:hypothetical protein GOHSU_16_00440 [Gordonia hirsuta DSM 44140 = NBRC 16056]|uniref:SGNH hydrolase-type esterase domain-containing protein n=1 Tax=Gordonia hirsuta DSM 44140 = NBRC 16056 TaxID=1121927 RepID=L7LAN7_9ACTN|nr:hypothetical protein [Gordonia hirsuta]GAC57088.1 hypothetical protein GOHSU_16_00440 [Gordonia hirsuta DSM 44140 = NBRC 16056]
MTPEIKLSSRTRRPLRHAVAALGVAALAGLGLSLAAPAAYAEPADAAAEALGAVGRLLQEGTSNGSANLPGLNSLLDPDNLRPDGPRGGNGTTSCSTVVHIGDSTSVGIDDAATVGDPAARLSEQYRAVGVTRTVLNADGGRSIVERVNGAPNAVEAIASEQAKGHRGCWVIAMGVNDAANIGVGSTVHADERIDRVMGTLDGQRVLWPTVSTRSPSVNGYSEQNMTSFNQALRRATQRYPNLRVMDLAAQTQPGWFTDDGIHYSGTGSAARNRLYAAGLASAFP